MPQGYTILRRCWLDSTCGISHQPIVRVSQTYMFMMFSANLLKVSQISFQWLRQHIDIGSTLPPGTYPIKKLMIAQTNEQLKPRIHKAC